MESVPFSSGRRYELGPQPINLFAYHCGPTLIAQPTVRPEGVYLHNGFSPLECTQDFLAMKSSPSELLVTSYPDSLPSFRCSGKKRPLSSYSISPGCCLFVFVCLFVCLLFIYYFTDIDHAMRFTPEGMYRPFGQSLVRTPSAGSAGSVGHLTPHSHSLKRPMLSPHTPTNPGLYSQRPMSAHVGDCQVFPIPISHPIGQLVSLLLLFTSLFVCLFVYRSLHVSSSPVLPISPHARDQQSHRSLSPQETAPILTRARLR